MVVWAPRQTIYSRVKDALGSGGNAESSRGAARHQAAPKARSSCKFSLYSISKRILRAICLLLASWCNSNES
jgi:hypothetical protein